MNLPLIANLLGRLHLIVAAAFLPSAAWAIYFGETPALGAFIGSAGLVSAIGAVLLAATRRASATFYQREALALVCFGWIFTGLIGALPYCMLGVLSPVHAIFESFSGFTTTGATVVDDIEALPKSLSFWRCFTHWIGGVGILAVFLIVLPTLGAGGRMLFRFEASHGVPRMQRERLRKSVGAIITAYVVFTGLTTVALQLTGKMDLFEALCHAFSAIATGGFSPRQDSIAAYDSFAVEIILILCMICGATSFGLHTLSLRGDWRAYLRDAEWRMLVLVLGGAILICALNVSGLFGRAPTLPETAREEAARLASEPVAFGNALRTSAFNVVSVMTTTGFATDDWARWPAVSQVILLILMNVGGSAGSTAGGAKVLRILVLFKMFWQRVERTFRSRIVRAVRVSGQAVERDVLHDIGVFLAVYLLVLCVGTVVMAAWGLPLETALSSAAACMSCTGPGLGYVGPMFSYSYIPDGGLLFLCGLMLVGRLELFTFLVLLLPAFWQTGK